MLIVKLLSKTKRTEIITDEDSHTIETSCLKKYLLSEGITLTRHQYIEICNESDNLYYYRLAIEKLKRRQTTKEIYDFLIQKGATPHYIKDVLNKLFEKKYLNDFEYGRDYVIYKGTNRSAMMITSYLKQKGLSDNVIELALKFHFEKDSALAVARKYIKEHNEFSKSSLILKLSEHLRKRGFLDTNISFAISEVKDEVSDNDETYIKRDYQKLFKKYKGKYNDFQVKRKIYYELYKKGYKSNLIKEVFNHELEFD